MAAPTLTARTTPAGIKLKDGYRALVAFASHPDIEFWEKTVKPPGIEGGEPIDQTTMHNNVWRTSASRALRTMTSSSMMVAYDPVLYNTIVSLVNKETVVSVYFRNGDAVAFWGFLQKFDPADLKEGTQPEATVTFMPTNYDPGTGTEEAPVFYPATGT